MLSQLISTRSKRGINEVGTVWKWLAGTPDHDDLIKIQNSIYYHLQIVQRNRISF